MPRAFAMPSPPASGRLLITCVTAPSMRPVVAASMTAAMFEPRPEIRIVMRASATAKGAFGLGKQPRRDASVNDRVRCAVRAHDDGADVERLLAGAAQRVDRR